jgi:hypothetical protein
VIYCDTSFLGALYLPGEKFEPVARPLASAFAEPMVFPWLSELELSNSVYRAAGRRIFSRRVGATILRQITRDKATGLLFSCPLEPEPHFRKAMELTKPAVYTNLPLQILGRAARCRGLCARCRRARFL